MNATKERSHKATVWLRQLGLTIDQLAQLTGYSVVTLRWYFKGMTPPRTAKHIAGKQKSKPIEAPEWRRFSNICAGVEYQMKRGKQFDFE